MTSVDLVARLDAAERLLELAGDRLPSDGRTGLAEVVARAQGRLAVAGERTVVAIAGPTGVGKSSLTNALLRAEVSRVGVTRPTTSEPQAVVVGDGPSEALVRHLGLTRSQHLVADGRAELDGLVLVDLPDHDSVVTAHRDRAAALVAGADRLVWVVDPEKYADASVHDDLLAPLREHAGVLTVVVNRIDRLAADERDRVAADLHLLLARRGLADVEVLTTSTTHDLGIAELRTTLAAQVRERRAAGERISADLRAAAGTLAPTLPPAAEGTPDDAPVVEAALTASGVPAVLDAVARTHRHRARRATGWPVLRRLQARGRTPLARLGLGRARAGADMGKQVGARSSLPVPHGVATATLRSALRTRVAATTATWPTAWAEPVEDRLGEVVDALPAELDRAIAAADLDDTRRPRWWVAVGSVQWLLLLALLAGAGWLVAIAVVAWLQLPDLPLPRVHTVPVPTLLLGGAAVLGLLVGAVAAAVSRGGARRARGRVAERLEERVRTVIRTTVAAALADERARADDARTLLATVAGTTG